MGERLLDVDVLAGLDGGDRQRHVPMIGRADEHRVHVLAGQHGVIVARAESRRAGDLPRLLQILVAHVADRGDACAAYAFQILHEHLRASARADAADADSFVGRISESRGGITGRQSLQEPPPLFVVVHCSTSIMLSWQPMPRILFLTERYPPDAGGVSASASRIAGSLAALGAEVDVVAWTRSLQAGRVAREAGPPTAYRIGRFREWDTTMPHTLNLLDWLASMASYDLVWGHYLSLAGFLAVWFGRLHGVRSVVSIRGNDLDRDVFPPGDFARLEWTLKHATCVTAVTRELARKAKALCGRDDVIELKNVVDSVRFAPSPEAGSAVRASLGIGADEALLGFCGELREKKGLTHLLDALVEVRKVASRAAAADRRCPPVGGGTAFAMDGPGMLDKEAVVMTGQLTTAEAVNAHLQACDVYLQPSLWDGMPNALLEAMAAGCGCIASDAGGIPEIITPGVDGIIVPRWQLHRLGEAVLEWLQADAADRDRMRRAARERMVKEFSLEGERAALQTMLAQTAASAAPARSQV